MTISAWGHCSICTTPNKNPENISTNTKSNGSNSKGSERREKDNKRRWTKQTSTTMCWTHFIFFKLSRLGSGSLIICDEKIRQIPMTDMKGIAFGPLGLARPAVARSVWRPEIHQINEIYGEGQPGGQPDPTWTKNYLIGVDQFFIGPLTCWSANMGAPWGGKIGTFLLDHTHIFCRDWLTNLKVTKHSCPPGPRAAGPEETLAAGGSGT